MKCFQCERPAVGICRWCFLGQCEEHMRAGLEARARIPTFRCVHEYTGEAGRVRSDLEAGTSGASH